MAKTTVNVEQREGQAQPELTKPFFSVWASDFGRFFPATSGAFR